MNTIAQHDINDLIASYTMCGDRGDAEGLSQCFAKDGVLVFPGAQAKGPHDIVRALSGGERNPHLRRVRHHLTSSEIRFLSDTEATGRTYFIVITNEGPDHSGLYVDRFTLSDDGWKFTKREVRIDWQSNMSLFRPLVSGD